MKQIKLFLFALALTIMPQAINAQTAANAQANVVEDLDAKYATNLLKPGTDAPDINLKTIDGKQFSLKSLRGKYVVLDFWATWCPDCRKDSPYIMSLYEKFAPKGVEFVGVSFDTKAESWKNGVEKLGIKYTQVSDMRTCASRLWHIPMPLSGFLQYMSLVLTARLCLPPLCPTR